MREVRVIAICVFRQGSRILVGEGYDEVAGEMFLRPLGGAVKFGERAANAVRREIREELGAEVSPPVQLGVLENLFTHGGRRGHEVVFVFDAQFADPQLYEQDSLPILVENIWGGAAVWVDLNDLPFDLCPGGLEELLTKTT